MDEHRICVPNLVSQHTGKHEEAPVLFCEARTCCERLPEKVIKASVLGMGVPSQYLSYMQFVRDIAYHRDDWMKNSCIELYTCESVMPKGR